MEITSAEFVISNTDVKKWSDWSISRIRLHRAVECRKVEPYQYADCPQMDWR